MVCEKIKKKRCSGANEEREVDVKRERKKEQKGGRKKK
jgi:hypothetical protein